MWMLLKLSEWIKIGVHTGAGKTAWPQGSTYGKRILGHMDLTLRTAIGEHVKSGKRLNVGGCDDWRGVQAILCKPLLLVGECTSGVAIMCGDKIFLFHMCSTVAKKIEGRIQKEMTDSQHHRCTVAYKEHNVYNIYMKPNGNEIDAMLLSQSSDGSWPGPSL